MWWEETYDEMKLFHRAMEIVEEEFYLEVRSKFLYLFIYKEGLFKPRRLLSRIMSREKKYILPGELLS